MLDKVIKEFNINNYIYQLGYDVWDSKVYPILDIYKDEKLLSGCGWTYRNNTKLFYFYAYSSSSASNSFDTIKNMFNWLRQYSNIPQNIEQEYESIFLLYKLNDFNELNINT